MIFSREYVNYLARQTVNQLIEAKMIRAGKVGVVAERVNAAILEELSLEDRINEEVRVILDAYQEDMRRTGASYAEMFKKDARVGGRQIVAGLETNYEHADGCGQPGEEECSRLFSGGTHAYFACLFDMVVRRLSSDDHVVDV